MFATWAFFPADGVCFDAGDGLVARLRHKVVRLDTIALSHGHRDHIAGLFMFLNVRCNHEGTIQILYPREARIVREIERWMPIFDRNVARVSWKPMMPGEELPLKKKNLFIRAFNSDHYRQRGPEAGRSLGYHLIEKKKKVREPLRHLSQEEIFAAIKERGRDAVLEDVEEKYVSYSGDTAPLPAAEIANCKVLMHECTFLDPADAESEEGESRWHKHSDLDSVMRRAVEAGGIGHLVLYHFSTRYTSNEVRQAVQQAIAKYRPEFPVSAAMPGAFVEDVLKYRIEAGRSEGVAVAKEIAADPATDDIMDQDDR